MFHRQHPKTIQVSAAGQLLQQLNGFVYGRNVVCIAMADKNARCLLFLQKSAKQGIHGKEDLLAFIKEEHLYFKSFLQYLPDFC